MDASTDRLSAAVAPRSPMQPQRQQIAERDSRLSERFAEELAAKGRDVEGKGNASDQRLLPVGGKFHERHGGRHGLKEMLDEGLSSAATFERTLLREATSVAASRPAEPSPVPAHVERIAAAIAELQGKGDQAVQIDFGKGSAIAEGALVIRDVQTGAFSIRITGLVPTVNARRQGELHAELREGLEERHIRATISFGAAPPSSWSERGRSEA